MFYAHLYPDARYIAVEIDLRTGKHQLLNNVSASMEDCIGYCQVRGVCPNGKDRKILMAHTTGASNDEAMHE